jgi:hypothetical protein
MLSPILLHLLRTSKQLVPDMLRCASADWWLLLIVQLSLVMSHV